MKEIDENIVMKLKVLEEESEDVFQHKNITNLVSDVYVGDHGFKVICN